MLSFIHSVLQRWSPSPDSPPAPASGDKPEFADSAYVMERNETERLRMNGQHVVLRKHWDGRVVAPGTTLSASSKVLDSGTGSGAWILDAASLVPNGGQFVGIDISARLFPAKVPSNVTFHEMSITSPPEDWAGTFDLIHQRFLIAALRHEEWVAGLASMLKLLKPGGSILLTEARLLKPAGPEGPSRLVSTVVREVYVRQGLLPDCGDDLPELLKAAGFVDIHEDPRPVPLGEEGGDLGRAYLPNFMGVVRAMKGKIAAMDGLSWKGTEQEWEDLVNAAQAEYNEIPGLVMPLSWFTARKPL